MVLRHPGATREGYYIRIGSGSICVRKMERIQRFTIPLTDKE